MDTTNENMLQVNTFSNGMDTDTSDMLISDKSYRLAKNLRYITDVDETTGELRLIEGATSINVGGDGISENLQIVAFNSIRNVGALICKDINNNWAVYRIDSNDEDLQSHLVFGWCTTPLGDKIKISTVLKWEADDRLLLYIADGEHCLMKINLYDESRSNDIKYISSLVQHVDLYKMDIDSILNGGSLKAGLILYTYRLYNKNNISTQIAPLSDVKYITNVSSSRNGGLQNQEVSEMGLLVKIDIYPSTKNVYPYILIYRIQYLVNGQSPEISLIFDNLYDTENNSFVFDDFGLPSLLNIMVEEFNSLQGIEIIPSVIESKNGILFAGNVTYSPDILDDGYLKMDFRAFSSGDGDINDMLSLSESYNLINDNLDFSKPYDQAKWLDDRGNIGGIGENIKWELNVEDSAILLNTFPEDRYANIDLLKTYNKRNLSEIKRGLAHDEIYRYGIILYSKNGTKYPVKWIADIRTPNIDYNINDERRKLSLIKNDVEYANILYVTFTILHLFDENKISGYEIVRVHRTVNDRATISQGIISSTIKVKDKEVCVSGMPFIDRVYYYLDSYGTPKLPHDFITSSALLQTTTEVLLFYSPETLYQIDDLTSLLHNYKFYLLAIQPVCPFLSKKINDNDKWQDPSVYKPSYNGDQINNVKLTHGFYSNSFSLYKLNYSLYKTQIEGEEVSMRLKWYNTSEAYKYFIDPNKRSESEYGDVIKYIDGLNVYKLFPVEKSPTAIYNGIDTNYNIDAVSTIKETDPDKLITDQAFNGKDLQSTVGDYTAYHCTAPFIFSELYGDFDISKLNDSQTYNTFIDELISTTDPSLVLVTTPIRSGNHEMIDLYYRNENENRVDVDNSQYEYSILCNIRRNTIPYGGFSKYSRDNSTYTQYGYYESQRNIINVYGDTAVSIFEFVPSHEWYSANKHAFRNTTVCLIAVESTIDTSLDCGDRFSNSSSERANLVQVNPCNFNNEYIQKKPAYVYNTAYSIDPQLLLYNQNVQDVKDSINTFDYRVHYSNQAEPNQASDPWLKFQPLNYLDVDSRYGEITELRTFKNTLLFWLQKAVGILSVNERVQITDNSNLPLILGTGGVLDRYDYLSTTNGMKENQHADVQSDSALYWWDYDNHMICQYAGGNSIIPLSKAKSVLNFLNKRAKSNLLINTDLNDGQWPLLIHDNKYNEILFKVSTDSLVYSEQQQRFTSVYDIDPHAYLDFNSELILLHKHFNVDLGKNVIDAYKWNQSDGETSVGFNETKLIPYLKYVVNNMRDKVKVYDNVEFAGTIPGSFDKEKDGEFKQHLSKEIHFEFKTPLNQQGKINGELMTNRQLDFKFAVPRCGYEDPQTSEWVTKQWGDRMRGKTMQCEMSSDLNSLPFSLQYIFTKYRISWS